MPELVRLAESWMLPISPTHRRPQLFDANHPNYGGYMGTRVPRELLDEMIQLSRHLSNRAQSLPPNELAYARERLEWLADEIWRQVTAQDSALS